MESRTSGCKDARLPASEGDVELAKMEDDVEFVPLAHSGRQREDDVPLHGPVDNGINVDCRLLLLDKL